MQQKSRGAASKGVNSNNVRLRLFTWIVASVCSTLLVVAQSGTTAPPPQEQRPTFRTEANFVRVDVYPTAGGTPVTDLRAEDFELLEDGVVQSIQAFEHVVVRPAGPQSTRAEPNTIGESRDMARNPRARIVVLFLDVPHVTMDGAWRIREPLIHLVDQILGPDDLVGVMTPRMAPSDVVLARKTDVIAGGLRNEWPWGERFTLQKDKIDLEYENCYPPTKEETNSGKVVSEMAREMTERRRERATLDALDDLVIYLRDLRDERKAILTVSEGWLLFRPNTTLTKIRDAQDPIPGVDPISVGPDGRITTRNTRNAVGNDYSLMQCNADRMKLAYMDNGLYFRQIMDDANRANATFYTVDPRGLPVFDNPIGPEAPPPVAVDAAMLHGRQETLRTLAGNTDGIAVMGNNDLDVGMKRIADDLTSYYLLGYYSTNAKLDGKFHNIRVRVKRPGVDVRARRGYRSATAEEVARAKAAAAAPVPESLSTVAAAIGALSRIRPEARLHINAVPQAATTSGGIGRVWVAGELTASGGGGWATGGTAEVEISGPGTSETARVTLAPGQRGFLAEVVLPRPIDGSTVDVRVRLIAGGAGAERTSDSVTAELRPGLSRPLLFRRGQSTANRLQPAASFLFSRTERVRLEVPIDPAWTPGAARLLDKAGQPLAIPVTAAERTEMGGGQRWLTADVTLAPLAPGDYAIELSATTPDGEQRTVTAIRIVR
jgi:VWFA-related protein